ncbi:MULTISPECIES: ABC transporter permease [Marinobacter]|jgi:NitT/TauT family transport system permease protein|uniref:ABC transporter ATP-binding protein n=2 Tax=Marinobacter TaxID=2742 RepID=W5YP77_9GAMM|nr:MULTISPECIES: ABC transporter permease [Marinobacter]AHI30724.1 ABC transporter ATP-binding protein [Marinobacter salarius]KXJ47539.1 MAG: ABC transporter ATP-binding protein [Marinobacter sp. Hex_13]MAB52447.1 ABC transporter permease [Marinobacter sp.]MBE94584.1 ABC transporter permease [Marinobacter sp.]MBP54706.1 ABC transporter permease [Marinobacter sp.]|tara:strand:- start:1442 stop:2245 length:804 start_codon:yes stop_codon:yes gene_type:complete
MKTPLIQNERFVQVAAPLLVGVLVLLMWQLTVVAFEVPKYIVPSPVDIGQSLVSDFNSLFNALMMTLKVTFLAFAISVVLGVAASLLFVQSKWIEISLFPYAVLMQVTPIVAIAPLIIIWVNDTTWALTICAVIVAIFPIISNTTLGLRSVDPNLLSMFRMYRTSRWQELVRLRVPSALPYFFGGLRISSGLALIGAVVAEFVAGTGGAKAGLAYMILQSGYNLQIPKMFAALILITVTGILLFALMVWMSDRALRNWHESALKVEH